ncbi:MAG: ATP-binding cassette domain-containing protein [Candidatus Omnitrophica bacterium]|nr:ATP-binding cassette domain-containing protein [Candidatus Omnitrophota bacterium]
MILKVENVVKEFKFERGFFKQEAGVVRALDDVSFEVEEFSSLGIVGESGSGKTTLAKIIMELIPATSGKVVFDAERITNFRKDAQIIFQNPYNSLDPKMRIINTLSEPLLIHGIVPKKHFRDKAVELLRMVGLDESLLQRYPIEFSGGQRQRICIARALATEPKFILLDEPISSLDLTIQAEMLDLFLELKAKLKLTYIFISHNLAVIRHIADSVIVMESGKIVERGLKDAIFNSPANTYTKLLLEAARG